MCGYEDELLMTQKQIWKKFKEKEWNSRFQNNKLLISNIVQVCILNHFDVQLEMPNEYMSIHVSLKNELILLGDTTLEILLNT